MKKILIAFKIIIASFSLIAQTQKTADLYSHVDNFVTNLIDTEGTNEYQSPSVAQLAKWRTIINNLFDGNYATAHTNAGDIDYKVVEFTDNSKSPNKTYYVLEKTNSSTNYWGTFIYNPLADRQTLFIQSPHPENEFNTGEQGFSIFREIGARAFYMAGIWRCNNDTTSVCDGTTSTCGVDEPFRISDQAHVVGGMLQKSTEALDSPITNMIAIQLHGFTKGDGDPDIIMSNGIQSATPPMDYLATLKTNLEAEDNTLTFEIVHLNQMWTKLRGLTNTQGRLINGAADPCDDNATVNTGRFLHLEQAKAAFRQDSSLFSKMSNALANTFPLDPLPVDLTKFDAIYEGDRVALEWSTATEMNNYGFEIERASSPLGSQKESTEWEVIGFVQGHGNSSSPKNYSYEDYDYEASRDEDKELILKYRLKQIDTDGSFEYYDLVAEVNVSRGITGVMESRLPVELSLSQNYPNPFNPVTTIQYSIPTPPRSSPYRREGVRDVLSVSLKIYDILGNEVSQLVNKHQQPGTYEVVFDLSTSNNADYPLSSGIYIYQLSLNGAAVKTRKMVLAK